MAVISDPRMAGAERPTAVLTARLGVMTRAQDWDANEAVQQNAFSSPKKHYTPE